MSLKLLSKKNKNMQKNTFLFEFKRFPPILDAIENFDAGIRYVNGHRATAKIFSTYPSENLSIFGGIMDQVIGTAMLCFFVAAITDRRNKIPLSFQPMLIGFSLMLIGMAWGMNVSI